MIYLASPYSSKDPRVMQERFIITRFYCNIRMKRGDVLFSPIVYGHQFATEFKQPTDFLYWKTFNDHMLTLSKSMTVLCLPGWKRSKGVTHEIELAEALKMDIEYVRSYG